MGNHYDPADDKEDNRYVSRAESLGVVVPELPLVPCTDEEAIGLTYSALCKITSMTPSSLTAITATGIMEHFNREGWKINVDRVMKALQHLRRLGLAANVGLNWVNLGDRPYHILQLWGLSTEAHY